MRLTGAMLDVISCVLGWGDAAGFEEIVQTMSEEDGEKFCKNAEKAHEWVWQEQKRRAEKRTTRRNKKRITRV